MSSSVPDCGGPLAWWAPIELMRSVVFAPSVWVSIATLARFSAIWLLPIALWMCARNGYGEGLLVILAALVAGPSRGAKLVQVSA